MSDSNVSQLLTRSTLYMHIRLPHDIFDIFIRLRFFFFFEDGKLLSTCHKNKQCIFLHMYFSTFLPQFRNGEVNNLKNITVVDKRE